MSSENSALIALVIVAILIVVVVAAFRGMREKFGFSPLLRGMPTGGPTTLYDYRFRYDPALVSGAETVMYPWLFHGI